MYFSVENKIKIGASRLGYGNRTKRRRFGLSGTKTTSFWKWLFKKGNFLPPFSTYSKVPSSGLLRLRFYSAVGTLCRSLFVFSSSPLGKLGFVFLIFLSSVLLCLNRFFLS